MIRLALRHLILFGCVGLFPGVPSKAYAYIDPGSGIMMLQIVVSLFFGVIFGIRQLRNHIIGIFRRIFGIQKKERNHQLRND